MRCGRRRRDKADERAPGKHPGRIKRKPCPVFCAARSCMQTISVALCAGSVSKRGRRKTQEERSFTCSIAPLVDSPLIQLTHLFGMNTVEWFLPATHFQCRRCRKQRKGIPCSLLGSCAAQRQRGSSGTR